MLLNSASSICIHVISERKRFRPGILSNALYDIEVHSINVYVKHMLCSSIPNHLTTHRRITEGAT